MNGASNARFGMNVDGAMGVVLDDYSTPDSWYRICYELEFVLVVGFGRIAEQTGRVEFMNQLLKTLENCFGLGDGHIKIYSPSGEFTLGTLEKYYGLKPNEIKILPPYDDCCTFQINVLWNKGRFDLRILMRLQSEINSVSKLNCANVELVTLCIIPRSQETMSSKLTSS